MQKDKFILSEESDFYIKKRLFGGPLLKYAMTRKFEEAHVPEGVTAIGDAAFRGRTELRRVILPSSVISIGRDAFRDCENLFEISFGTRLENIESGAFSGCIRLREVTLPDSLLHIGDEVFKNCPSVKSLTLPRGLKSIGEEAFDKNGGLIEIVNKSKISLKDLSFNEIYRLPSSIMNLGDSEQTRLTEYGDFIFYDDGSLALLVAYKGEDTEIELPRDYYGRRYSVAASAFAYNDRICSAVVPMGVEAIGRFAFFNCSVLSRLILPDGLNTIGDHAISAPNLTELYIPDSVTKIGETAICIGRGENPAVIKCAAERAKSEWHISWISPLSKSTVVYGAKD